VVLANLNVFDEQDVLGDVNRIAASGSSVARLWA
jgi:hypothetical protein